MCSTFPFLSPADQTQTRPSQAAVAMRLSWLLMAMQVTWSVWEEREASWLQALSLYL